MKKLILGVASAALALGSITVTTVASAKDRYPPWVETADLNRDGMVSKDEFLQAMAKMYDEKMVKMKAMAPAAQAKMMKGDLMTYDGYRALLREISGGQ